MRYTCPDCGIVFGRFQDFSMHNFYRHSSPSPEVVKATEELVKKYRIVLDRL